MFEWPILQWKSHFIYCTSFLQLYTFSASQWLYVHTALCRYLGSMGDKFDQRMLQIKLPDVIQRVPRSISLRKFWKGNYSNITLPQFHLYFPASEWKSFLLYLVPATLNNILPDQYYVHVFLLIKAVRILLSDSISEEELKLAEKLLKKFCTLFEDYYGKHIIFFKYAIFFLI